MITLETALLTAISAVVSALVYVSRLLWQRSEKCEKDRDELRCEIETLRDEGGFSRGRLEAVNNCPQKDCPFNH